MDEFVHPPWTATPGETAASNLADFDPCLKALKLYAAGVNGQISAEDCSSSPQWGQVVRARIAFDGGGPAPATLAIVVWSDGKTGPRFAAAIDGCCGG